MHIRLTEDCWLNEYYQFSLDELSDLAGLTETEIHEWVDEGLLAPVDPDESPWRFNADCLLVIRRAARLRRDFELEPQGLALVVQLLERIQNLETEVRQLQAKLPRVLR